jgi:PPOX class probable F420-dependent enzyme
LFVETDARSYKVERIRRWPRVAIAPCSASGRLRGDPAEAVAEVLGPEALEPVRRQMRRKYRIDRIFALPIYRAIRALRGKPVRGQRPVIVAITPI